MLQVQAHLEELQLSVFLEPKMGEVGGGRALAGWPVCLV